MTLAIIQPKAPTGKGWVKLNRKVSSLDELGYSYSNWFYEESLIFVISALEVANDIGQPYLGPEYHLSISQNRQRCDSKTAKWVLKQFQLEDATEDNHVPYGFVRNFWRPVADNLSGYECKCKDEEPAIVENKGDFVWRGVSN